MQTLLTITSGTLGFLSAIVMMFNWLDVLTKFQLKRNVLDWKHALRIIEKSERRFQSHFDGKQIKDNYSLIGALYGIFTVERVSISFYDKMHQVQRRSHNLQEYSLQEFEGVLSRVRVTESFREIQNAILRRRENNEQRDLRMFTFWLLLGAFASGTAAALMQHSG